MPKILHTIFIFGKIDETLHKKVTRQLNKISLIAKPTDTLLIIINSGGGDEQLTVKIIEAIIDLQLPIITVGHKIVGSAATMLLAIGGHRLVTAKTKIVHHEIRLKINLPKNLYRVSELVDLANSLLGVAKIMFKERDFVFKIITRDSKITPTFLKKIILQANGNNVYFSSREAKKVGFVHAIIPSLRHVRSYVEKKIK